MDIGILHPGAMGASVAAAARATGHRVYWAADGRSDATAARAHGAGAEDAGTLADLCGTCEVLLSVCPPHGAIAQAEAVAKNGFRGLYVDGNAVSPATTRQVADAVTAGGAAFVDGGIVGPPAWETGTCLYLSGPRAVEIPPLFDRSPLETIVLGDGVDTASALKMVYAARTKGTTALLAATLAAAESLGVRGALEARLAAEDPSLPGKIHGRISAAAPKAWRWIAEMEEIAATFSDAGTAPGFHAAAAEIYAALEDSKNTTPDSIERVLSALIAGRNDDG